MVTSPSTPSTPERTRRALVVRGGWDGHMPVETTDLFVPFLEANGFDVRIEESTVVYTDADYLETVDLIVQINTMSTIEPAEFAGLQQAVLNGTGLAGWHGGIADAYPQQRRLSAHDRRPIRLITPARTPPSAWAARRTTTSRTRCTSPSSAEPIRSRQGIDDFDLVTEQYWVLSDDYNDVLATTTQDVRPWDAWNRPVTSPAIWTRQWGKGRVFVSAPGHRLEIVESQPVRTIIERGLLWAAR